MAFGAFASSGPDLSGAAPRRRSHIAIILLAPGVLYLVATFIAPLVSLVLTSFKEPGGAFEVGEYVYAFRWENYLEVFERFGEIFLRTFGYSIIATIIALVVSYLFSILSILPILSSCLISSSHHSCTPADATGR